MQSNSSMWMFVFNCFIIFKWVIQWSWSIKPLLPLIITQFIQLKAYFSAFQSSGHRLRTTVTLLISSVESEISVKSTESAVQIRILDHVPILSSHGWKFNQMINIPLLLDPCVIRMRSVGAYSHIREYRGNAQMSSASVQVHFVLDNSDSNLLIIVILIWGDVSSWRYLHLLLKWIGKYQPYLSSATTALCLRADNFQTEGKLLQRRSVQ